MTLTQINKAGLDEIALDHVFTIGASGSSAYTFQGEGLNGTVNNPTLYLTRGKTYRFENGSGGHPIRIQSTSGASGTAYNTGVTNNAGSGTVIVEVQHDAPDVLYYQCTSHAAMNGILYVTGALADGSVTTAKLASSAVGAGNLQTASVETAKIQDQAVTLAKLPHGTSSNDGKFLRANNGADPSFELIPSAAISAVANDGANRVLTSDGDGTATAESNLTVDSSGNVGVGTTSPESELSVDGSVSISSNNVAVNPSGYDLKIRSNSSKLGIHTDNASGTPILEFGTGGATGGQIYTSQTTPLRLGTNSSENMRVHSDGNVGIGTTSPSQSLHVHDTTAYQGIILSGNGAPRVGFANATIGASGANGGAWSVGIDGTNGDNFCINNSNDNSNAKILLSSTLNTMTQNTQINGNLKFGSSGNGIDFSATSDASGKTSEILDDYEEGTWNPVIYGTGNAGSWNPSTANGGFYVKIGKQVTCWMNCQGTLSGASGDANVSGLPFTSAGVGQPSGSGNANYSSGSVQYWAGANADCLGALVPSGNTYIYFHTDNGSSTGGQISAQNASHNLHCIVCYFVP